MGTKACMSDSNESSFDLEEIILASERSSPAFKKEPCVEICISSESDFSIDVSKPGFSLFSNRLTLRPRHGSKTLKIYMFSSYDNNRVLNN